MPYAPAMGFATLPADWTYKLGQAFLDAAVACDAFTCERRWVSDGSRVEQPAPGCPCQLVAVVSEGFEPLPKCSWARVVEVRLILDLCTVAPPGEKEVPDPAAINAQAQKNASIRWLMMTNLRRAQRLGELSAIGEELGPLAASLHERIKPGPWRLTRSTGGIARWEAVWRFEDDS